MTIESLCWICRKGDPICALVIMNFSPCLILILILNSYHLTLGRPPQWMWGPAFPPPARWPSTRQHTPLHPLTRPEAVEGAKPYFAQAGVLVAAGTHAPCTRVSRQGDRNPRPLGAPPYKGPCIHQGGIDPQGGSKSLAQLSQSTNGQQQIVLLPSLHWPAILLLCHVDKPILDGQDIAHLYVATHVMSAPADQIIQLEVVSHSK